MVQTNSFDIFTPEEIERFVRATGENDFVDAKAPLDWKDNDTRAALAKDIAAFANSAGGGAIVLGKKEGIGRSFEWLGLSKEQRASFDTTAVAQWVNNRFSPSIRFSCHQIEVDSKWYIVITVAEFTDTPVICTKPYQDSKGILLLQQGNIYVRTANAASAPLSTPEQVSHLIGRAVTKQQDRLREIFDSVLAGHTAKSVPTDEQRFSALASVVEGDLLGEDNSAKDKGFWKLVIHPDTFMPRWTSIDVLTSLMQRTMLHQRRFPQGILQPLRREWGISGGYCGAWGLAHEGLFLFMRGFTEDVMPWKSPYMGEENKQVEPGKWMNFDFAVDTFGDFFAFLSRFAQEFDPECSIRYSIAASNIKGRYLLGTNSSDLMDLGFQPCVAARFPFTNTLAAGRIAGGWKQLCVDCLKAFIDYFPGGHEHIGRQQLEQRIESYAVRI
jgi:hypothetical protein